MEELEALEDRARAFGASITQAVSWVLDPKSRCRCLPQETYIRDLNLEFTNITELAESAKSAQVATATLYNDWQEIKLAENTLPKIPIIGFLSSTRQRAKKKIANEWTANFEYFEQGERGTVTTRSS